MFKELLNQDTVRLFKLSSDIKASLLDAFEFREVRGNEGNYYLYRNGIDKVDIRTKEDCIQLCIKGSIKGSTYDVDETKIVLNNFKNKLRNQWDAHVYDQYGISSFAIEFNSINQDILKDIVDILESMGYAPRTQGSSVYF